MKHLLPVAITAAFLGGCATAPVATIHTTTKTGNVESVKQLLANGADVNVKSNFGETPLDLAVTEDKPETADLLRKHGGKTGEELKAGN